MTLRIAHVNVTKGYRGGERQTELLIRGLAGRIEQVLVARRGEPLAERVQGLPVELRLVAGHPLGVAAALGGVDLVHVHEGRSVYAAYLRRLFGGAPYVVTRRVDNPIRRHRLAYRAYRGAARIVAIARQVADVVRDFDPGLEVDVIYSSSSGFRVDRERAAAIRRAFGAEILVGNVAALDNGQKAQEHIIAVARRMQSTHPHVHFVLVGDGRDEAMLKAAAMDVDNLSFTGFVDNVGDYLAAFDIFILPSRREGIGSILLDAMERRLPIIATRVGGVPEIVIDGVNGLLIEPDRPDQLHDAIVRLAASAELRRRLGEQGPRIAAGFTSDVMCSKYLALYRTIAAAGARADTMRRTES